jgi:Flp pilus assembly pilin Flp
MLKAATDSLQLFFEDEFGSANLEYAVLAGLIVVGVVAIVTQVGPRVLTSWLRIDNKLDGGDGSTIVVIEQPPPTP